ncbi:MAG: thioredoxin family protein [Candidatus Polarisedimenticolia bacterium]
MKIEVLGPGCSRCAALHENVLEAVRGAGAACEVEKVTDMRRIAATGAISTPILVIDGEVKSAGRVLSPDQIKQFLG